ncbi:hydrogenase 2 accessory protein HypG [Marinobacterium nitratireducens]|uniref:Hydrogenase 2 accessory protein HypG n=1 Tax=Marinobacterium nitratireducens TaxID=518897 RepID=A0A918DW15_9GAMM|nr:HypC/HybG/HupF family hydrogenase formation chaperone [Marinobacterium nitratireducens]GGO86913.1 hydrogenase 2 accessory protein HypG [Marinobacterium nitratireducens]
MCLAVPAQVLSISDPSRALALADSGGVQREIELSCVIADGPPETLIGAWVLVHVGVALAQISEQEALASLALWAELDDGDGA